MTHVSSFARETLILYASSFILSDTIITSSCFLNTAVHAPTPPQDNACRHLQFEVRSHIFVTYSASGNASKQRTRRKEFIGLVHCQLEVGSCV